MTRKIRQVISWNTVKLQNDETKYILTHDTANSTKMPTGLPIAVSLTNTYILDLNVPTSNTTLTVWVAARPSEPSDNQGDFSDPQFITYTSMFGGHYTI